MKWAKVLEIERDVPCRRYEVTIGLYDGSLDSHNFHTGEPEETICLVIGDKQLRTLVGKAWST